MIRDLVWPLVLGCVLVAATTLAAVASVDVDQGAVTWLLIAVCTATGVRPVRLPRLKVAVTPIQFFILIAAVELGPVAALAAALGGVTGAMLAPERPVRVEQALFNLASITVSTAAAVAAVFAAGARSSWIVLSAATVTFAAANSLLVAAVTARVRRAPFLRTWRDVALCESWCHPIGVVLTVLFLLVFDAQALIVASLVIAVGWLVARLVLGRDAVDPLISEQTP